jgi:hypothetical protein
VINIIEFLFSKGLTLLSGSLISEGGLFVLFIFALILFHIIAATLYMAVNEIRASAKESGMRFWEYGIEI